MILNTIKLLILLWIIIICFSCRQQEIKNAFIDLGDISIRIDTALFNITDTFLVRPDGTEMQFRKIYVRNNSQKTIYFGSPGLDFTKMKLIHGWPKSYYSQEIKGWNSCCVAHYFKDSVYFSLPKFASDTFDIGDPFNGYGMSYDTINFEMGYFKTKFKGEFKIARKILFKNELGEIIDRTILNSSR